MDEGQKNGRVPSGSYLTLRTFGKGPNPCRGDARQACWVSQPPWLCRKDCVLAKDIELIGLTLSNAHYNNNLAHCALPGPLGPTGPVLQIRPSF